MKPDKMQWHSPATGEETSVSASEEGMSAWKERFSEAL